SIRIQLGSTAQVDVGDRTVDLTGQVWVSHRDLSAVHHLPGEPGRGGALQLHQSHVHGDVPVLLDDDLLGPVAGADLETVLVDKACVQQVPGEHPHPVATHLGHGTVGVAIVHEPLGTLPGTCRRGQGLPQSIGAHDTQNTVAADTPTTV